MVLILLGPSGSSGSFVSFQLPSCCVAV